MYHVVFHHDTKNVRVATFDTLFEAWEEADKRLIEIKEHGALDVRVIGEDRIVSFHRLDDGCVEFVEGGKVWNNWL